MTNHLNDFQNILQSNRKISHFYLNKDEQVVWKRDDYLLREDAINLLELFQMNTCKLEGNPFDVNEELASSQMRFLVIENIAYSLNTAIDRQTNLKHFILSTSKHLIHQQQLSYNQKLKRLTKRETEILILLSNGLSMTRIAKALSISPHTVDSHRIKLCNKLNVRRTTELAVWAHKLGLLHGPSLNSQAS